MKKIHLSGSVHTHVASNPEPSGPPDADLEPPLTLKRVNVREWQLLEISVPLDILIIIEEWQTSRANHHPSYHRLIKTLRNLMRKRTMAFVQTAA